MVLELGLKTSLLRSGYSSSQGDLVNQFYIPCLNSAVSYDRSVGYFRSSLFVLVGVALSDFALRGGRMRLVCSPGLPSSDVEAVKDGLRLRESISVGLIQDLREILASPIDRPVVRLLATLVALGNLEIQIAYKPGSQGIYHEKRGIFKDASGDCVTFSGSSNETLAAWDPRLNHESFEVFLSWGDPSDAERVERHVREFEVLWKGQTPGLVVSPLPEVPREELLRHAHDGGIEAAIADVRAVVDLVGIATMDKPVKRVLMHHQVEVVEAWFAAGNRGIIDHATGAGKTIAALEIVKRWVQTGRPAVVLVPSDLLLRQWRAEIDVELAEVLPNLLQAGGGFSKALWMQTLADMTRDDLALGPRVTVATMQTASTPDFIKRVRGGNHLLVVADEVHRIGSPQHRDFLSVPSGGQLGLSATPFRFHDPVGTDAIISYFGKPLPPPFGIAEAIEAGRLVPYDYFPHVVDLTPAEAARWQQMSDRIAAEYARLPEDGGTKRLTDAFVMLLIRRARIIKGALAKVQLAADVVGKEFRDGQRWLVYCDDTSQLGAVMRELESIGLPVFEYHSAMVGAKAETLEHFRLRGGVLVAIRCLDEGVDIPAISHALILASSTNSREFIQRRGRVLRKAPGKYAASVHDALVVIPGVHEGYAALPSEIRRALEFAATSRNESARQALEVLWERSQNRDEIEFEDSDEEAHE